MPHRVTDKFFNFWLSHTITNELMAELALVTNLLKRDYHAMSTNTLIGESDAITAELQRRNRTATERND